LSHLFALTLNLLKGIFERSRISFNPNNHYILIGDPIERIEDGDRLTSAGKTKGFIMRIQFLLFLTILISSHAYAETPTCTNNPSFTANPTFTNTPVHNTTISPQFITNTTSTINAVGVQVRDIAMTAIQKVKETFTKDNYNATKETITTFLWNNRYKLAAGTILTAYTSTNLLLLHDYHYLKDMERWSRWKSEYSFELLCAIPHAALTQQLICSIGECHYNKQNPNDASHPLITFIATIEKEINICKRYLTITHTIKKLHLSKIFPINDEKINEVNACLERALFVKHIFLSWLTERNLRSKTRKKVSVRWPL
jgi:uncharacterized protein YlbG (UPF0298 family)